jgi:photosystem II stability/assembly factor-like uncharacterized protein
MKSSTPLYLGGLICLVLMACSADIPNYASGTIHATVEKSTEQRVVDVRSELIKNKQGSWNIGALKNTGSSSLRSICFPDKIHGWVGGEGALYETADGGETWVPSKIEISPQETVSDIFFLNSMLGWIVIEKGDPDITKYREGSFQLMHTSDGGKTWKLQYAGNDSEGNHVSFVDEQVGWLVGYKYTTGRQSIVSLIMHTADQGEHWTEVGGELNSLVAKSKDTLQEPTEDGPLSFVAESPTAATVLTRSMRIYRTVNSGQSWQQVGALRDELDQTRICCLETINGGRLWIGGGAYSEEGIWGMLAVEQSDNSWVRYRLGSMYFADVFMMAEKKVYACGAVPSEKDASKPRGVVLSSSDGGSHWSIIYRNAQVKFINALAAIDANHIWAVGDGGLIIRLDSSQ